MTDPNTEEILGRLHRANDELAKLQQAHVQLQDRLHNAQHGQHEAERKLAAVKKLVQPSYDTLKELFEELGTATAGNGAVSTEAWQPWIDKAPGAVKKMIPLLLERGALTTTQLCTLTHINYTSASKNGLWAWLKDNRLATIEGGLVTLVSM